MAALMEAVRVCLSVRPVLACNAIPFSTSNRRPKTNSYRKGLERRAFSSVESFCRVSPSAASMYHWLGLPLFRRTAVKARFSWGTMSDTLQLLWGRDLGSFGETQAGFDPRRQGSSFEVLSSATQR